MTHPALTTTWVPFWNEQRSIAPEAWTEVSPHRFTISENNASNYEMTAYLSMVKAVNPPTVSSETTYSYWFGYTSLVSYLTKAEERNILQQWMSLRIIEGQPNAYLHLL